MVCNLHFATQIEYEFCILDDSIDMKKDNDNRKNWKSWGKLAVKIGVGAIVVGAVGYGMYK